MDKRKNDSKDWKSPYSKKNKWYVEYLKIGMPAIIFMILICLWILIPVSNNNNSYSNKDLKVMDQSNNTNLPGESTLVDILTPTSSHSPEKSAKSPKIASTEEIAEKTIYKDSSILLMSSSSMIVTPIPSPTPSPIPPSSIPVQTSKAPEKVVQLFQDFNYGGWKADFGVGSYTTADIVARGGKDKQASSIKIAPGYRVRIFYYDKFYYDQFFAPVIVLTKDTPIFTFGLNDCLSSMIVEHV
jgi:hypothetical protein